MNPNNQVSIYLFERLEIGDLPLNGSSEERRFITECVKEQFKKDRDIFLDISSFIITIRKRREDDCVFCTYTCASCRVARSNST